MEHKVMSLLHNSRNLGHLRQAHALVLKTRLDANNHVVAKLLRTLLAQPSSRGDPLPYARSIFDSVSSPDAFIFNTLMRAELVSQRPRETLSLFLRMRRRDGVFCDSFSLSLVVQACGRLMDGDNGRTVHAQGIKIGFESDLFVQTALIEMYAKLGSVEISKRILDDLEEPDLVSFNVLLAEYVRIGEIQLARDLFDKMLERDLVSWNTMIHGYATLGDVMEARKLFDDARERDVVSWSSMIGAYARTRQSNEALKLFHEMQLANVVPDNITMVSVLAACGDIGALGMGKMIHEYIKRTRIEVDMKLGTSLVDMYAKCGDIDNSLRVFNQMDRRDVLTWSSAILGLANHGSGQAALQFFSEMIAEGIEPDDMAFVGVLSACSHMGLVDEGRTYFTLMSDVYGIAPKMEHYGCMVDILARAGRLQEARELIRKMPFAPDAVVWRALLGGCRVYKESDLAEEATVNLLELEPNADGNYVLLSNIYTQEKKWDKVIHMRKMMRNVNIEKVPGSSSIEVDNAVHEFIAGDRSHPRTEEIYQMLSEILEKLKAAEYKPLTSLVSHDLEERQKEIALAHHSEKLAIAFGLLSTNPRTPLRIVKNLRICDDCHLVIKLISKIYDREIIVRDRNRFHHFLGGSCTCKEYW
ncbi:pentatricopeptide repeat-containing protein At1g74630 [Eucalyptus grandis]|uniref:pentatricopeptide repeat-containing protein At1g74630 n=1 Tax=Eucalyptus grandis TaxID=71139 RepID=UPI00192E8D64|nr:pentatricopeptide repeat-containing protein At1g74630 [Eucalyptus grandis]